MQRLGTARSARRNLATCLVLALAWGGAAAASTPLDSVRELASQGRGEEALRDLEGILAQRPNDREGLFLKGVLLVELRRTTEAETVFADLISSHPDLPEPYNNLAVLQAAGGRYDAAVDTLQRALETHPSYETAYSNLTKIYGQLASEAYDRALSGEPAAQSEVVELVLLGSIGSLAAGGHPAPAPAVTEPLDEVPAESAVAEAPAEPLPEDPPASVEAAPAPAEPLPAAIEEEVTDAQLWAIVEAWAAAWSGQQVDDYLSFYAQGFAPASGLARAAWERQRRQRLTAPEFIRVSVALLGAPERKSPTRSAVTFMQVYESNTFSDTVTKTLELVEEGGSWKILAELVEQ